MPGVGFIGGKLSVIGGYSWPGGVDLMEEFDEGRRQRLRNKAMALRTCGNKVKEIPVPVV